MALIRLETNASVPEDRAKTLAQTFRKAISLLTGEPATEVRVEIHGDRRMRMATSDEPLAHVELRNVEFPKDRAAELTRAVCPVLDNTLGIHENNVYIAVISKRNSMWRVNGAV